MKNLKEWKRVSRIQSAYENRKGDLQTLTTPPIPRLTGLSVTAT